MKRGKQTCKILKEIRRQIAEANDIEFITSECQYQGDCLGTCPKCESEVHYLEQQLERKRMAGKAITLFGISAGLVAFSPMTSCSSSPNKGTSQEITTDTTDVHNIMFGEAPVSTEDVTPIKDTMPTKEKIILQTLTVGEICDEDTIPILEGPHINIIGEIAPIETPLDPPFENDTLDAADIMPEFPGGQKALMEFIAKKIEYPPIAQGDMGHGRVIVQFIINKDGEIVLPKIMRSVDPYLDKEALKVVGLMPKWKPGELADGTKVAVRYTIPVIFRLQ